MGKFIALKRSYAQKQKPIQSRLAQFKDFYEQPVCWTYAQNEMKLIPSAKTHHDRLFEELAFCILAANTSAEMGMRTVDRLRDILHHAQPEEMTAAIRGLYRFINLRPQYIVQTREYFGVLDESLHELVGSFANMHDLRNFLADNMGIKGLGYKEASHFLRNIGVEGFAILDKHIINSMHENEIISDNKTPSNKKQYLELEEKYLDFSKQLKISPDELDLLLWSNKTGIILK